MTESELLAAALAVLKVYQWKTLHIRPGITRHGHRTTIQGEGVGFPDIFAVKGIRSLAIECKSETGKLTPEQQEWLRALSDAGAHAMVLRPSGLQGLTDWLSRPAASGDSLTGALRQSPL